MISRRDAAQRLDIPVEMLVRHDFPSKMSSSDFDDLEQNPPPWLVQSRANRSTTARPVWFTLKCDVCGFTETERPKKWWPEFTYLSCDDHNIGDLPDPADGLHREEVYGIGSRFIGLVDSK
jgi:hypothetical protein